MQDIMKLPFSPRPPLREQNRIISRLDVIMPLIDEIGIIDSE